MKPIYTKRHRKLIELLTEERKRAGLSQSALARKLHQYQSFIARVESGQRGIEVIEFLAICEAIGGEIDPNKLLRDVQKVPPPRLPGPLRPNRNKK